MNMNLASCHHDAPTWRVDPINRPMMIAFVFRSLVYKTKNCFVLWECSFINEFSSDVKKNNFFLLSCVFYLRDN